jgi:hypothetical protein
MAGRGVGGRGSGVEGRDSDHLQAGRSEDRISVGERFCAPVQTGPGGDYPPPSSAEVTERVAIQ